MAGSGLLPLSSIQIAVQAAELSSQSSQDGVIKACTGQSVNLGASQLTEADLKVLTGCGSGIIPQLVEALKSRDWTVKVIAAHTLGLYGKQAQSVIPELSSLMQDENADVRFAAAQALGDIGTEAVVPVLAKALQDKDENVRVSAVTALQQIGSIAQQAKPVLINALWDGNWYVRSRAAATISKLGLDEEDIPNLLQPWRDGFQPISGGILSLMIAVDPNVRSQVHNIPLFTQNISLFFIKALQNKDPKIRESAAFSLGKISQSIPQKVVLIKNSKALLSAVQDKDPKVRQRVTESLVDILDVLYDFRYLQIPETERIKSALMQALHDPEANVRLAAIKFLAKSHQDMIFPLLDNRDTKVRKAAISLLRKVNPDSELYSASVLSTLVKILQESTSNVELRRSAIKSIQIPPTYTQRDEVIILLDKGLQDLDLGIRIDSAFALRSMDKIDAQKAATIFSEGLRSENPSIQIDTITGLKSLCPSRGAGGGRGGCLDGQLVLPLLINALKDNNKRIQYAAVFAIAKIEPKELSNEKLLLKKILKEETDPLLLNEAIDSIDNLQHSLPETYSSSFITELGQIDDKRFRYNFTPSCTSHGNGGNRYLATSGNGFLELIKALDNENIRRISAETIIVSLTQGYSGFVNPVDPSRDRNSPQTELAIRELTLIQQNLTIGELKSILTRNIYVNYPPVFKEIFKLKNQDRRRSAIYILGGIGERIERNSAIKNAKQSLQAKREIIEILTKIVSDPDDDQNIRWMAALSLQIMNMNIDQDQYFSQDNLTKSVYLLLPGDNFVRGRPNYLRFDIYSGEYISDNRGPCGGPLSDIYFALRNLISKTKK
jgi:HEAT repeat protein